MSTAGPGGEGEGEGELPATLVTALERACDRFEADCRAGLRPRIEDYLGEIPEAGREALAREMREVERAYRNRGTDASAAPAERPTEPTASGGAERELVRPSVAGYEILGELGRGGMGVVYKAMQVRLNRPCALKMILAGDLAGPRAVTRFLAEAEAAARLRHPHIVQVYALGEHDGRPYLELEYLEGGSLAKRLDGTPWPPRRAAELIATLAGAVEAMHSRGIVHRDLKPANILLEADGTPKIADFGLAKALGVDSGLTGTEEIIGTPSYMAPEQARGGGKHAGPSADVYALGAILYELLTGRPPFKAATVLETLELVRSADPVAPQRLVPKLPIDLETISLKCMQKEPQGRYGTAADLADELGRYLRGEPIRARRISAAGRAWRWCRRNPVVAPLAISVPVLMVAGTAVSGYLTIRAVAAERAARSAALEIRRQRDEAFAARSAAQEERDAAFAQRRRADQQAAIARAVNDFLQTDLLAEASPEKNPRDRKVTVEDLLGRAAAKIPGKFADQPEVEAAIRRTIGETYRALGLYAEGRPHLERALALRRQGLGPEDPVTLMALYDLARMNFYEGRYDQAEPLYQQALDGLRRVRGPDDIGALMALNDLAVLAYFRGDYDRAEPLFRQALDGRRRALGTEHPDTWETMNNLAMLYSNQGRYGEAEPLTVEVLDGFRRIRGLEHPDTLTVMNNLAMLYLDLGRYDQAGPLFQQVLDVRRRTLKPEHPETLASMHTLAMLHRAEGRCDLAEPLARQAVDGMRHVLSPEHPETLNATNNLARVYLDLRQYDRVEELLVPALEIENRILGEDHRRTLNARHTLAWSRVLQRRYAEAEPLLRRCLAFLDTKRHEDWMRLHIRGLLGASLLGRGKYAEAEPLLLDSYEGLRGPKSRLPREEAPRIAEAGARIVELYEAWGKKDKAADWRGRLGPHADTQPGPRVRSPVRESQRL
jgi:non-specific serine/threonine protein kinase/serine/threonine-protein kinase